jgi:pre-mRNA-splicing helicase BRR2
MELRVQCPFYVGKQDTQVAGEVRANLDVDAGEEAHDDGLRVQEIDAYWLQRRIARALGADTDASKSQEVAEDVLASLASNSDQRSLENELVLSLGFEQFELIKELIRNRLRVVWCTRLSRAQVSRTERAYLFYHRYDIS